jgi:CheY-like chemotaxis protein
MTKLRVLIVDDERAVADSLCLVFQKYGFIAQAAYSADDGLDCARTFLPQLLLCDLSMPGMGGLVMASMIAHELPECRVLMLTGDYHALDEAWATGASLFRKHTVMTKPVHPESLLREAYQLLHSAKPGFPAGLPLNTGLTLASPLN